MRGFIGLGSNLGNRQENLAKAALRIKDVKELKLIKTSSVFENAALLDPRRELHTQGPFLNAVAEVEWSGNSPITLLTELQCIENDLGRSRAKNWDPRVIDLDILILGENIANNSQLTIPHPETINRNFVLAPLAELAPNLVIPGTAQSVIKLYRKLPSPLPQFMHIVNLTPDSFSEAADAPAPSKNVWNKLLTEIIHSSINYLDVGAESTRPGASPVSDTEEWHRLQDFLIFFNQRFESSPFRPKLSLDTWKAKVAAQAIKIGVDAINDVSGLKDPDLLSVLKDSDVEYILTHSLGIPADPSKSIDIQLDPVAELKNWLEEKLALIEKHNISLDRIIFDPGIGFGKTAAQSLYIMKNLTQFHEYKIRLLVGHSRKSFMNHFTTAPFEQRDAESLGISLALAQGGADIIRIHNSPLTARAQLAWQHLQ